MKVVKVFNNNVVLGVDDRGVEVVLLGRGLGFGAAAGADVEAAKVERRFVPSGTTTAERIAAFVDEIPAEDIVLTERVVEAARAALGDHVTEHVRVPMADHISFALRRAREGVEPIEYPMRWEVQHLYPAEVAFARQALDLIAAERGVRLPDVETVPLALHLVNAQLGAGDLASTVRMTEVLGQVLGLIRSDYDLDIDDESVEVARFVTHLRYLFVRGQRGTALAEHGGALHDAVRSARPREWACAERVAALLTERFGWAVTLDEVLYLTIHVSRLTDAAAPEGTAVGPQL